MNPHNEIRRVAGRSILLSVLMMLAGISAIIVPPVFGVAVTMLVGCLMLFTGVAHLAYAWHSRHGLLWALLLGVVYIVTGAYLLLNPLVGLASLTFVLAIYLLLEAILEFVLFFLLRPLPGSGWLLVDAIITLILGLMIWRTWPASSFWVLGTLVGISMLFSGFTRLTFSLAARRVSNALP